MAFPQFPGNVNSQYLREIYEWTKRQAQLEREKEEEEQHQLAIARQQQYYYNYAYNNPSSMSYGGISRSAGSLGAGGSSGLQQAAQAAQGAQNNLMLGMLGLAQASQASEAPVSNPHKALTEKISALSLAEPAKLSARRSPDYTATLTGWRGWTVKNEKLAALGMTGAWEPKKAKQAKCQQDPKDHRAPAKDCSCGYWSFKSLETLTKALASYTSSVAVVGSVEIWGRVIECENGWRSEYAYPKELWLLKPDLEYLSEGYGVAVRRLEEK